MGSARVSCASTHPRTNLVPFASSCGRTRVIDVGELDSGTVAIMAVGVNVVARTCRPLAVIYGAAIVRFAPPWAPE